MLESREYLVPTNAGQPFLEKPPLYYWTAVLFARTLHPWLGYADGARMASVFFMALSFCFVMLTARLISKEQSFLTPRVLGTLALFAGTVGMIKHSHDMFTDVALVCGGTMAMYGLLRIVFNEQNKTPSWSAAIWFGLGVGIAEMSKGLFIPIVYAATAFMIAILIRECRSRTYLRMIGIAVLVSLPFFIIWPALLAQHSYPLFMEWFWENNVGRFLGFSVNKLGSANDEAVVVRALFSFALPCAPLALLAVLSGDWRRLNQPHVAIPAIFTLISGTLLMSSATARQLYLLPLIMPLSLLASSATDRLPGWMHISWDWLARSFFGTVTALVWLVYITSLLPVEQRASLSFLSPWLPSDFVTPLQPLAFCIAVLLGLGWLLSLPRLQQFGKWRGALSWFGGITLMWGTTFTLLLPWIDRAKSYEYVYQRLTKELIPVWGADDCMASVGLGESEAPTLFYYAKILHRPLEAMPDTSCRWVIVQDNGALPEGQWTQFWTGARDGDREQTLTVYRRQIPGTASQPEHLPSEA